MSVTVDDYSWWRTWRPAWAEAHCVTLVGDISAEGVVDALHADPVTRVRGVDALYDHAVADWPGGYDPSRAVIGVAMLDDGWTLVAEVNGYVGVTERLVGPLSSGRTVVSHFRNVNAVHTFHWWHDGRLLVDADLMFPAERTGTDPDAIVEHLRSVAFPLDADPAEIAASDLSAAGFALAQRITGVACTPVLFERSDFVVATVDVLDG